MINIFDEVNETNKMVEQENLDVRTITIGISLLECIDSDLKKLNENIYNRLRRIEISSKLQMITNAYTDDIRTTKPYVHDGRNVFILP